MTAGRPPKPTSLKVLHGTARQDRANPTEPKPPVGPISRPSWLRGRSITLWKRLAPTLEQMGVLTVADTTAMALLCTALAEFIHCTDVIQREGEEYETASGIKRPRPQVRMAADAWRRVDRMLSAFGSNPSARSKIHAAAKGDRDPFEDFLSGRSSAS